MTIELTPEEADSIRLNEEYTEQQWLTKETMLSTPDFHPALYQCAKALR